jgi:MtN3 and saliva related transmembrane protein
MDKGNDIVGSEQVFGIIGALIAQSAGVPQFLRLLKTRTANDVSLLTFVMLFIGAVIMLTYFSVNFDLVGVLFNTIGLLMDLTLIITVILFRRRK